MRKIDFTVEQVEISGWKLTLSVSVKGQYDENVHTPKVAVIFDSGKQTRRVPILVQSYSQNEGRFLIYSEYTYDVRNLFFEEPLGEKITMWFDVMYGEEFYEHTPFTIGSIVNEISASEEETDNSDDSDENEEQNDSEVKNYNIAFYEEQGIIELNANFVIEPEKERNPIVKFFSTIINVIWTYFQFFIGVCLLPVFMVDGFLATLKITKRKASIKNKKGIRYFVNHVRWRLGSFSRLNVGIYPFKVKCMLLANSFAKCFPVKKNRIVFLSNRRTDLSGNFEFVYNILKEDKNLEICFLLDDASARKMKITKMIKLGCYFANSKIILVDDFMELLFKMPRREGTTLIQLWHACGAFKTFGCSRLGKKGGQTLKSRNHRNYDYATVSSSEIAKFYAEGFGLSQEKVVATGVPRTDIFFDENYKKNVVEKFYQEYPKLRDKKIVLFAPTFRGNGKNSGHYPIELFNVNALYEQLGNDYAIIIKHHPFVNNRNEIQEEYKDYIIDLSDNSELNDLLFVTDVLITDYSSVVFEASLLDIPMLFYVFDLDQYIATRGFYYEYATFVPGKIIYTFDEVAPSILNGDLEQEKIETFKNRFFDDKDGKSSQRTVDLIYDNMK